MSLTWPSGKWTFHDIVVFAARPIIRQNVFVGLSVVAAFLPATIFGLGIGPAVIAHSGSTLLVVFDACACSRLGNNCLKYARSAPLDGSGRNKYPRIWR